MDQAWRSRTGFDDIHRLSTVVDKLREIKEPGHYGVHPRKTFYFAGVRYQSFGGVINRGRVG